MDFLLGICINNYVQYSVQNNPIAYIQKGNNSELIRHILRKRYWWTISV